MDKRGSSSAPPDYDAVATTSSGGGRSSTTGYIRTWPGMLKVAETALCVATLICAVVPLSSGWGAFVSGLVMAECIVLLVLHLTGLISRLPYNMPLPEFISAITNATLFLIAAIVCATSIWAAQIAYAALGFVACAAFVVDAVFQYRILRSGLGFTLRRPAANPPANQEPPRY